MWVKPTGRSGIRIRGSRGHPVVRSALVRYAGWLRANYCFPMRVPVYLLPGTTLRTLGGELCSASFFAPFSRTDEPYIRVATGDYTDLSRRHGRDSALAAFILSLSHEVLHYQQWIRTGQISERGVAVAARAMLRRYERSVAHP